MYMCIFLSLFSVTRFFFFSRLFVFSSATPMAYGGSQARGLIGAIATGLRQSHSNLGSEPGLTAMPDPQPTERGHGSNLQPHGS